MKIICIFISLMTFFLFQVNAYAEKKKLVLIIHSYHPEFEWVSDCTAGIEAKLNNKYQLSHFYMNTKRLPSSEFKTQANLAWEEYQSLKPDLVMTGDDNALKFLYPRFIDTKTPVVYFGVNNNPRSYFIDGYPENITGVLERTPIIHGVDIIKKFLPSPKKILLIMDKTPTSDADIENTFKGRTKAKSLKYLQSNNWDIWKKTVLSSKEKYDALLLGTYYTVKDTEGKFISYKDVVTWITQNSPVPTFGYAR